jgi:hypothetical protein
MKMKLEIQSFDDDEIDLMVEKMDLNKDNMINVAELLDLTNLLNINKFEEEIKFMFAPFSDKTGTCKFI